MPKNVAGSMTTMISFSLSLFFFVVCQFLILFFLLSLFFFIRSGEDLEEMDEENENN